MTVAAPLRLAWVVPLIFTSGACGLILQTAWLRELRLIFGASTAASAAVLAIFMGGLGFGAARLGGRADRAKRPLELYGHLELGVATAAALSPVLIAAVRAGYIALGGQLALGDFGATLVRLLMSVAVLAAPTFLMGGTLPAAVKAIEAPNDTERRGTAWLYGLNTLGAVAGALLSTFFLLEVLGTQKTLWFASALLALVGIAARNLARRAETQEVTAEVSEDSAEAPGAPAPALLVIPAAAVVGFVFLLMELVWFRMLAPLLGGSTFTFGLILAVALLGIGLGGALYAALGRRGGTLSAFGLTCALEALGLALPFAAGDQLAVLAAQLRGLGAFGFFGLAGGWALVTAVVVLPAAIVSGYQFPLLVALMGRGRDNVGRHVGHCYAANTGGSIVGSLAGGFGLLPLLTAPGAWRLAGWLLVVTGVVAATYVVLAHRRRGHVGFAAAAALIVTVLTVPCLLADGPSSAWRHGGVGAGRSGLGEATTVEVKGWIHARRRAVAAEWEGLESSVALGAQDGMSFIVNGKVDGNARGDAATQVMAGLMGALMLEAPPERAMVVGLGTGSTAGWLAAIPEMTRVDVVELEPAILEVAKACAPVNHDAMADPKLHVELGDAREVLLTSDQSYALIMSEPSNPYRAGIANLFTHEFYRAVAQRLQPGGVFLQWLQAYEIEDATLALALSTLRSVFPHVEVWHSHAADLILVASDGPRTLDISRLRARIATEPYRSGLLNAWRAVDAEGFLARFLFGAGLVDGVAGAFGAEVNHDDLNLLEFRVARSVGGEAGVDIAGLRFLAAKVDQHRPAVQGEVDWRRVEAERLIMTTADGQPPKRVGAIPESHHALRDAHQHYNDGEYGPMLEALERWGAAPQGPVEIAMVAEAYAQLGDPRAEEYIGKLRAWQSTEADALLSRLRMSQGQTGTAALRMGHALMAYHQDPWPLRKLMQRTLTLAQDLCAADRGAAARLFPLMAEPFVIYLQEARRMSSRIYALNGLDFEANCVPAFEAYEPNVPWETEFLGPRLRCYLATGHPLAERAARELKSLLSATPRKATQLIGH